MSKSVGDIKLSIKMDGMSIDGLKLDDTHLDLKTLENKIINTEGLDAMAKAMTAVCLADSYHYGKRGMPVNISKAYTYYYLAGLAGHRAAQHNVASLIWEFIFYNKGDKPKLLIQKPCENFIRFLTLAAEGEEGFPRSKFLLAKAYYFGKFGIAKNGPQCFKYLNEVTNIYPNAYCFLGQCYEKGYGTPQDFTKALTAYQKGAELNDPDSINELGLCYKNGKCGLARDTKRAVELFERAINLGLSAAKANLALLYMKGEGVPKDIEKGLQLLSEQAETGDLQAQIHLSQLYMGQDQVKPDDQKMFKYTLMAAKQGNSKALYNVGKCYRQGIGCSQDAVAGFKCLSEANAAGEVHAKLELADCYMLGAGVTKDLRKCTALLREYLDSKDESIVHRRVAERMLGQAYASGMGVKKKDQQKAFTLMKSAAEKGDAEALASLGVFYMNDEVGVKDFAKARELFETSLRNGHRSPNAVNSLVNCLINGKGGGCDKDRAFQLLKSIESSKSAITYQFLALCFLNGWGTPKDVKQATEYLELSVEAGNFDAEVILAGLYLEGTGVKQDIQRALGCFKKGHGFGNPYAENALAMCYVKGLGEKSKKTTVQNAFALFKQASSKSIDALNNLGWCYLNGIGTDPNPSEAVKCFEVASAQGSLCAVQNLGWCALNGFGMEKNVKRAHELFTEAAFHPNRLNTRNQMGFTYLSYYGGNTISEISQCIRLHHQNNPELLLNLANCLKNGWGGISDQKTAFELYLECSEKEHRASKLKLVVAYKKGQGIEKNYASAYKIIQDLVDKDPNDIEAYTLLAQCYLEGWGVQADPELGLRMLEQAASNGYAFAETLLGWCFERGLGKERDLKQALKYYRAAAEKGCATGQLYLAFLLDQQLPASEPASLQEIFELYLKSANQNNSDAMNNVAACYEEGAGTEINPKQAFLFYFRSAKQGNAFGQYNLAKCYRNGLGTEIDMAAAKHWFQAHSSALHGSATNQVKDIMPSDLLVSYKLQTEKKQETVYVNQIHKEYQAKGAQ